MDAKICLQVEVVALSALLGLSTGVAVAAFVSSMTLTLPFTHESSA
jgi:hypothetical protein